MKIKSACIKCGSKTYFLILFSAILISTALGFSQGSLAQMASEDGSIESSPAGEIIKEIKIIGNNRIETELIELNIGTKAGENLQLQQVQEDIRALYNLGYFENVVVEYESDEEGVTLFYVVDEKPVLVDLRIRGNDDIKTDDIKEVMTVREGRIIDLREVAATQEAIKRLYSQKGFVGTEVSYQIEPLDIGTVGLYYDISEGQTAFIKKVEFRGNVNIRDDKFKDRIYSRPRGFLSFITKRGLFNVEEIRRDSERIRAVYLDNGFLDVSVSPPDITYLEDEEGYKVTFNIEEGPQYTVGNISVSGELVEDEETLLSVVKLEPGNIFSSLELSNDISRLTTFYGDRGFAFANVNPRIQVNPEDLSVDVDFELEKSHKVFIRHIDILGNTRTRDRVVRRELTLQEQQPYSASKLQAARRQVTRLGFFEDNVEVNTRRVPGEEDTLDVDIRVEERPTGFFSVAGGFSSVEKILFAGQIQESNLFGYGKRVSLNAQIGGVTQIFSLNYQDLNFMGTDWTFDFTVFLQERRFRDFDRDALGFNVGVGRRIYRDLRARIAYRYENVEIDNIRRRARLILSETDRTISSGIFGLIWDSRNNFLDPTEGNLTRTFIEYAGPFGGNTDFIKYTASSTHWVPFWRDTFFQLKGQYGIISLKDTGEDLVIGERFFLGGPNSLRGFKFRRVGPRVPTEDGDFVIIGGVQQMLFSADYVFPLLPDAGLRGVVFFDIGNVFNDGENITVNPSDLKRNVGFGFRWLSPLGPLRLEVGIPVGDREVGEDSFEIQFSVGNLF